MARYRDTRRIQVPGKRALAVAVEPRQLTHDELHIAQPHRLRGQQRLLVGAPRLPQMAAKNRLDQSPVWERDRGGFIDMVYRSDDVAAAGEVLKEKRVVGKRTRIAMGKDDHGI